MIIIFCWFIHYTGTLNCVYQTNNFILSLKCVNFQSRLAVNSVTAGDFHRPMRISKFVAELDAGFRLLNLKNDTLRKRFDGLKYDLKKVEEVVYDLTIRGLKPVEETWKLIAGGGNSIISITVSFISHLTEAIFTLIKRFHSPIIHWGCLYSVF